MWHVHAKVGRLIKQYTWTPGEESMELLHQEQAPVSQALPGEIGQVEGLHFCLLGSEAPYMLTVHREHQKLHIGDFYVTSSVFSHQPLLDAITVITGDAGSPVSRRLSIVSLKQIREAMEKEEERILEEHLDHYRVHGAVNGLRVDLPQINIWGVLDQPELVCSWNIPSVQPSCAGMKILQFTNYHAKVRLESLQTTYSPLQNLDRFWLTRFMTTYDAHGKLWIVCLGVGRKQRDFCLALRTLQVQDEQASLRQTVVETPWNEIQFDFVKLRDSSSIKSSLMLPEGGGLLLALEDPMKRHKMAYVDLAPSQPTVTYLNDGPGNAKELTLMPASHVEAPPTPEPDLPNPATPDPEPTQVLPTSSPTPPPSAAAPPEVSVAPPQVAPEPSRPDVTEQRALAYPGEVQLYLGMHSAHAVIEARVYVLGEGRDAQLRWWVSQAEGEGNVPYTLHLIASREVKVRVLTWSVL